MLEQCWFGSAANLKFQGIFEIYFGQSFQILFLKHAFHIRANISIIGKITHFTPKIAGQNRIKLYGQISFV